MFFLKQPGVAAIVLLSAARGLLGACWYFCPSPLCSQTEAWRETIHPRVYFEQPRLRWCLQREVAQGHWEAGRVGRRRRRRWVNHTAPFLQGWRPWRGGIAGAWQGDWRGHGDNR